MLDSKYFDPIGVGINEDFTSLDIPAFSCEEGKLNLERVSDPRIMFPDSLNLANQLRPLNLAIVGVTSDLMHRFLQHAFLNLAESIPGLLQHVTLYGTGNEDVIRGQHTVDGLRRNGLPLADYTNFETFLAHIQSGKLHLDGIYIATPPALHLEHSSRILELSQGYTPVFCEKPLVPPSQLNLVKELAGRYQNSFVPIDFFATTTPLFWFLTSPEGREIQQKIGQPIVINGSLVETQAVEHNRLGGNFGLLDLKRSGGGIMLDCMIHALTAAALIKQNEASNRSTNGHYKTYTAPATYLTQPIVDQALHSTEISVDSLRETAGTLSRHYEKCVINAQGAKGVAHDMFTLEILTDRSHRIVIGVGTDFQPPYFSHTTPEGKTRLITFEASHKEIGYAGVLYNCLAQMLLGKSAPIVPGPESMFSAATEAIFDIGTVNAIPSSSFEHYDYGTMYPHSIPLPHEIQRHVPILNGNRR